MKVLESDCKKTFAVPETIRNDIKDVFDDEIEYNDKFSIVLLIKSVR